MIGLGMSALKVYLAVEPCDMRIRPTKLGAKNWLFIGREEAGQSAAVLYTIMANCRRLGIDPREYLVDVLTRLPAMQASEAAELTPAAWQAARQGRTLRQVA